MKNRLSWVLGASVIISLLAILLWPQLIQELLVIPLTYLLSVGALLYRSLDQRTLWVTLMIVAAILFWASLKVRRVPSPKNMPETIQYATRIALWRRRLDDIHRGTYMRWRFAQRLTHLMRAALAYRAGLPDEYVLYEDFDIPAEIVEYLQAANQYQAASPLASRLFSPAIPQPLNLPPEKIADYIEQLLGMEQNTENL